MKTIHDPHYIHLIERLVARRHELGLTQEQVTQRLRVPRTWMGKVEQCERRLDVLETWRLCRLYGLKALDIEQILANDEKRP